MPHADDTVNAPGAFIKGGTLTECVYPGRDLKVFIKDSIKMWYLNITQKLSKPDLSNCRQYRAGKLQLSSLYVDPFDFSGRSKSALLLVPLPFHGNSVFQVSSV